MRFLKLIFIYFLVQTSICAQDEIRIHGYGSWGAGITDGNKYLMGDKEIAYTNSMYSLAVNAFPEKYLKLVAQVTWRVTGEETVSGMDYAYARLAIKDWFGLRVGRMEQAFGLYTKYFNDGTKRPLLVVPQSVYGPHGLTGVSYTGLNIFGKLGNGSLGVLQYDFYTGFIENSIQTPGILLSEDENKDIYKNLIAIPYMVDNSVGTRLAWEDFIKGLSIGASGYIGYWDPHEAIEYGLAFTTDYLVGNVFFEYKDNSNELRTEYVQSSQGELLKQKTGYVEASRHITKPIQIAFRFEKLKTQLGGNYASEAVQGFFEQLFNHRDFVFGANYWFNPNFVLKSEYHYLKGNRLAFPNGKDAVLALLFSGKLDEITQLFQVGIDFSF